MELVRYIHLNPLRAGLVSSLEELDYYSWSGHATIMGNRKNGWQAVDEILLYFSTKEAEARRRYREFIEGGVSQEKRAELAENNLIHSPEAIKGILNRDNDRELADERILGSRDFVERVLKKSGELFERRGRNKIELRDLTEKICNKFKLKEKELLSPSRRRDISMARAVLAYLVFSEVGYTCTKISKILSISPSGVSRCIERGKQIWEDGERKDANKSINQQRPYSLQLILA